MDKLTGIFLFAALVFAGIALAYYMQNQELKSLMTAKKPCGCGCASCSGGTTTNTTTTGGTVSNTGGGYYSA